MKNTLKSAILVTCILLTAESCMAGSAPLPTKALVSAIDAEAYQCLQENKHLASSKEDVDVVSIMCLNESFVSRGYDLSLTIAKVAIGMKNNDLYFQRAMNSGMMDLLLQPMRVVFDNKQARERLVRSKDIAPNLYSVILENVDGK